MNKALVYPFGIFVSILLSVWIDYRETVINSDAICYLLSAETIANAGLRNAMQLCGQAAWPFYSLLIYSFVKVSHLPYQTSAYLINGFFTALSVFFFIRIVKEIGGSGRVLWLAALVILLAHEFNGVREYIIRDHGFWACYLASILFLLQFFKRPSFNGALVFSASLLIAALFRIEGAFFLLAAPFLTWFLPRYTLKQRLQYFFMLNVLPLFAALGFGAWVLFQPQETLHHLGRALEIPNQLSNGLHIMYERFQLTKNQLAEHVLTIESASEASYILVLLMFVWYVISVVSNLSIAYVLLVGYAWLRRVHPLTSIALVVLFGYLLINLVITVGFLVERLFLSKRYLIALSLVCMLWVPFALDYLITHSKTLRSRLFLTITSLLIVYSALGGIFEFGYSKAYISQAGNWLAQNVSANATLYSNDYMLMYYSKHFGNHIFEKQQHYKEINTIAQGKWKQYDYLALRLSKQEPTHITALLNEIALKPIQEFNNKRGDKVVIFSNH